MFEVSSFDPVQLFFIYSFVFIFGACLGSFASAIIPREMNNQTWFALRGSQARSQCAQCQKPLSYKELLPILSYLLQKQKCACGQFQIPIFYPVLELGFALTSVLIFCMNGFNFISLGLVLSLPFLMACSWLNVHKHIMSDRLLIILAYIVVIASLLDFPDTNLWDRIYASLLIAGIAVGLKLLSMRLSSHSLYGWDIIKLWVIIAFWLGLQGTGYFLFFIGLGGCIWILLKNKVRRVGQEFPYGIYSSFLLLLIMLWF